MTPARPELRFLPALLLAALLPVAAATVEPAALPDGYWDAAKRREVLDATRTLRIAPDLSSLSAGEKRAVQHLLEAGALVQSIYERQLHPQAASALAGIEALPPGKDRDELLQLFRLSKGPIATTLGNTREPFVPVSPVLPSKGVYPADLTRAELDAWLAAHPTHRSRLLDPMSVVRRAEASQVRADLAALDRHPVLDVLHPGLRGRLKALPVDPRGLYPLPYSVAWADDIVAVYKHLNLAADAVEGDDADFAGYLRARARDLLSDNYQAGDAAWVTARFKHLDAQIGAYETYDDELLGVRAFFSLTVLVRRQAESDAVTAQLGGLQAIHDALPFAFKRKVREQIPVGVFDVIADFGQSRGGNTATILPNDAEHSRRYGRVIMMRDNIIRHPESSGQAAGTWAAAIVPAQQADLVAEASVQRTLWHEIGHYLGVDRTSDGREIDAALQDSADLFEEMKSDLVSLNAVPQLQASGYYSAAEAHAVYASGILRVLQRNRPRRDQPYNTMQLIQWNWFLANGVLTFDPATQRMKIDYARYPDAVRKLLAEVLALQAAGDRDRAEAFVVQWTKWEPALHEVIAKSIRDSLTFRFSLYRYSALSE